VTASLDAATVAADETPERLEDVEGTLDMLAGALTRTAAERDTLAGLAAERDAMVEDLLLEVQLTAERNDRIFASLEEAVSVSLEPLDQMFRKVGLDPGSLIEQVRRGYGTSGPKGRLTISTKGTLGTPDANRANGILERLDEMNLYRIAAEKAPFAVPVRSSYRFTSGFGPRWGRMHKGADFAARHGTPIHATADGVVAFAGRQSGYGNVVKIRHEFGLETTYAHNSRLLVEKGQRVSRGDHIADMGNTGRSTGTHLHYEVKINGTSVDPMTYIKAAKDVF
jgi:murein DD-endopeptidase MepM/ murein hydrolase activator NlpD